MDTNSIQNPDGDSQRREKGLKRKANEKYGMQIMDQMDDNLEVPKIGKSCKIANEDFQNSHLELDSTAQSQVEQPKIDTRTIGNLIAEGTERKKKIKNKDGLQCMEQSDIMSSKNLWNVTEHFSSSIVKKDHLSNDSCLYLDIVPVACVRRKLLVLDVNGLLADIVMPAPKDSVADAQIWGRVVFKRPSCDDFLKFCFEKFDVAIYLMCRKIIENFVNYLLGDLQHKLLFCWDMSHSTQTGYKTLENVQKPLVMKQLKKYGKKMILIFLGRRDMIMKKGYNNESNTLLLDDSPYKALLNPLHTAIFPHSYDYQDKSDNSLG
ncbi:Hypothetical predicted protein [Olea europaea subsp. europaea]|uniref:Mitochondrial import inner membrane translocase subunit TIM50 n=1 Tax=Olea europaea subsp. europaea TaxID=158383 RepID=A0A8S0RNY9_OLEEU|nr:Hypothetical predicted protein [Olea europaea subsp. europaea]